METFSIKKSKEGILRRKLGDLQNEGCIICEKVCELQCSERVLKYIRNIGLPHRRTASPHNVQIYIEIYRFRIQFFKEIERL